MNGVCSFVIKRKIKNIKRTRKADWWVCNRDQGWSIYC